VKSWQLGLKFLLRDWRAGELYLLAAALVIAVAAVSSVSWLAERVGQASVGRAAELLAADRVLRSNDPVPEALREQAARLGLESATLMEFPSVVLAGERSQLVQIKAVEEGYPLRGELRVSDRPGAPERNVRAVPPPGSVWLEPRLLLQLDLAPGDVLDVGAAQLVVERLLTLEPDRGGLFGALAPRLMMNIADIPATELVQPASRVRYSLLLAGPEAALERFRAWAQARQQTPLEWLNPGEDQPAVQEVIQNAQRFLGLGALLTVVVAGVAMLLTVRRYAAGQLDRVAIMRCLGAEQRTISSVLAWKLMWLGLFGGGLGVLLGYALQALMLGLVADLLPPQLPAPGVQPLLSGWLTGVAALLGFALPTVLRLKHVPPMRVLRQDLGADLFRGAGLYLLPLVVIFALMWWQARDARLAFAVYAAVLATLVLMAAAGAAVVLAVRAWRAAGLGGLLWFSGIGRRPVAAVVQVVGVGLGLMALFLLVLVRQDLLDAWRDRIPADAPNYFLINIQPAQVQDVRAWLEREAGLRIELYPMVRARLSAINGRPVHPDDYEEPRTQNLVAREFNLSWSDRLYPDNRVTAGAWWAEDDPDPSQLSVEQGLAVRLGIRLGDELTFTIAGETVRAPVTNLRAVHWDSFNVNFFVASPSGLLENYPATYITSFYLPADRQQVVTRLVREYPSITLIDINSLRETARSIMDQGARVVQLMATLTLLAGLLVLLAALQITGEERRFESALLRSLGASRQRIRWLARAEFWLLGAASGLLAASMAVVAGHLLARFLFGLYYPLNPALALLGALIGLLVVWFAGALGTRRAYRVSPMRLLRETREA
jgi:putative ABC transport system permease protein